MIAKPGGYRQGPPTYFYQADFVHLFRVTEPEELYDEANRSVRDAYEVGAQARPESRPRQGATHRGDPIR